MPVESFSRAMAKALRNRESNVLSYGPTAGYPALKETIAEEMRRKGSPVGPEDILVTNGAQQAIELVFRRHARDLDLDLVALVGLEERQWRRHMAGVGVTRTVGEAVEQAIELAAEGVDRGRGVAVPSGQKHRCLLGCPW